MTMLIFTLTASVVQIWYNQAKFKVPYLWSFTLKASWAFCANIAAFPLQWKYMQTKPTAYSKCSGPLCQLPSPSHEYTQLSKGSSFLAPHDWLKLKIFLFGATKCQSSSVHAVCQAISSRLRCFLYLAPMSDYIPQRAPLWWCICLPSMQLQAAPYIY